MPKSAPIQEDAVGDFDIGYRFGLTGGTGIPSNDVMVPASLFGRWRLDDHWSLGVGLEYGEGDLEGPAAIAGVQQDTSLKTIDSTATYVAFSAWAERLFTEPGGPHDVYGLAGIGIASVDAKDKSGPVEGGGTFDITTDAGTEFLASVGVGYRYHLNARWMLETLARYDRHFADWTLTDRNSNSSGTIDDYGTTGILFGVTYRP